MAHRITRAALAFSAFMAAVPAVYAQSPAAAATGRVTGKITDKTTGEGVYGALIIVAGTSKAVPADADGSFVLDLAPGTYTLNVNSVGFKPQKFENVIVKQGQTTTVNAVLQDNNTALGTVAVVGQKQTGSEVSLIKDLRKSEVVVSGVSSEQIVKTQDRDAAEVVKRIPGVTIQDSRFILVRGLAERYNTVMLNDAIAPSSEADVRAFSFDALPSSAIDRILIFKSAAPELPGDFAGGVVKVYTRNSATQNATVVNIGGGLRAGTTFNTFLSSERSKTDFLGFDSNLRSMPTSFPKSLNNLTVDQRVEAARQLSSGSWEPLRTSARPDLRLALGVTRVFDWGSAQLTTVTAASYSNTHEQVSIQRNGYENYEPALGRSKSAFDYQDERGTQNTRLGIVHNWAARLNARNKIEFRNLFNQIGTNQVTVRRGINSAQEEEVGKAVGLRYDSRTIYSGQLQGTHDLADDRTTLTWTTGYSYSNRRQPDYRQYSYTRSIGSTGAYTLGVPSTPDPRQGGRVFTDLQEHTVMASGQWERRFGTDSALTPEQQPKVRAGFYTEHKSRDFEARWPGIVRARFDSFDTNLQYLPVDEAYAPANFNSTTGFALSETTKPSNKYSVDNTLVAGYLSGALPIGEYFNVTGGVRVEAYRLLLKSGRDNGPVKVDTVQLSILPSVNATWNFSQRALVRVAASKTVNRPEFRELAPLNFYDFDQSAEIQGNPSLKPAQIYNADLRYEFYPTPSEMISLGVFGKQFVNPIEKLTVPSPSLIYNLQNTRRAWSAGLELEARQTFAQLSKNPIIQRLGLTLNASLIASRVTLTAEQAKVQQSNRALQGQSPYIINTGIFFQDDETGWLATALYNVAGPRIFAVGSISQDPDIYEMPRHQIDLTVGKRFGQHLEVKAGVQDLLNQAVQLTQDTNNDGKITGIDENIARYRRGQYSTMSVTYRF
jgi:TonB-dependent receptor